MDGFALDMAYLVVVLAAVPATFCVALLILAGVVDMIVSALAGFSNKK